MKQDYIYAVSRIRSKELSLLNRQDMDQLLACKTYEECMRMLTDKGWGDGTANAAETMIAAEEKKTWALIHELTDDLSVFDVLLYPTDYNNLKAAIKCVITGAEPVNVFLPGGRIEPEVMLKCVRESDFSALPDGMAQAADEAYHTLLQTEDGQLCDVILDKACMLGVLEEAKHSKNKLLKDYAELTVTAADIKIALRACKTGKSRVFLDAALAPCDTLDVGTLAAASCNGMDELFAYLYKTAYSAAADKLKESYSAFEKWCDDSVISLIKEQKSEHFTIGSLFAYVLARKNEIASVRIILSGKLNELDGEMIRQRVREMYV